MSKKTSKIFLASSSRRRKELLGKLGLKFAVVNIKVDEKMKVSDPVRLVETLALKKADAAARRLLGRKGIVLAADTVVVVNGEIMGKPKDKKGAARMLRKLSGRWHSCITGVALLDLETGRKLVGHEVTRIKMRRFSDREAKAYADTGEPLGKAGAYAVQGRGSVLIERIDGCFYNIVGLPLFLLGRMLREFGVSVLKAE